MSSILRALVCLSALVAGVSKAVTIDNFHQVDDVVYRSGRPAPEQVAELAPLGIKTVLSLETYVVDPEDADEEQTAVEAQGMNYLRIPMTPLPVDRPSVEEIRAALQVAMDPANQPVLVHCYQGSDRTGLVIGAYHIKAHHWSVETAIADMRNYGHSPLFYWWDDLLYDID